MAGCRRFSEEVLPLLNLAAGLPRILDASWIPLVGREKEHDQG
jgi:hypothetical protein